MGYLLVIISMDKQYVACHLFDQFYVRKKIALRERFHLRLDHA